jgi:hypothetical protein
VFVQRDLGAGVAINFDSTVDDAGNAMLAFATPLKG